MRVHLILDQLCFSDLSIMLNVSYQSLKDERLPQVISACVNSLVISILQCICYFSLSHHN